ncbi:MAG: lysophospholipid acyltransferase family protein [Patescibacteria group bacterium]
MDIVYYATRVVLPPLFARMEVEGRENVPKGACIFIANHETVWDAWKVVQAAGVWTPVHWVTGTCFFDPAAAGAKCFPHLPPFVQRCLGFLASTLIRYSKAIPYQRVGDPPIRGRSMEETNRDTFKRVARTLQAGESVGIFPEGRRSSLWVTSSFIRMALTAGVPVVPIKLPRKGEPNMVRIFPPLRYARMPREAIDREAERVMIALTGRAVTVSR